MTESGKDRKAKKFAEKLETEFKKSMPLGGKRYSTFLDAAIPER